MDVNEYARLKEQEMAESEALIKSVREGHDPYMRYKDVRPINDLKHMIETSVEIYGDRPAFWVKDSHDAAYRAISYKDMKADVDALGTALMEKGLTGKRIAVIGENCYEWAISYLAVVCGTGVVVPLDKELGITEIEQLIATAEVECVLYTKKFESIFQQIRAGGNTKLNMLINMNLAENTDDVLSQRELINEGKAAIEVGERQFLDAQIMRDEMCALLFTSGTTGIAKGVMLSHKNLITGIMLPPTVIHIVEDDVFFSVLPIHHSYECTCGFLIPLYRGASIAYCEGLKYIVKNLAEARPTVFLGVPLIFESLYRKIWQNAKKSGKEDSLRTIIKINRVTKKIGLNLAPIFMKQIIQLFGGRMRLVICGGAAIDPATLQGLKDFGLIAIQGYGLTECAPICALNPDVGMKDDAAGYLLTGFDGKIIDADKETGIGEICVKGDNVMMGYFNAPEATADVLKDGWFHTGDLGYIDKDKFVYITGRKKNVIITKNGKNVFPEELEYYLGRSDLVSECMVWGKDGDVSGETLIVASIKPDYDEVKERLAADEQDEPDDENVMELLWKEVDKVNEELAPFKRIKKIILRKDDFEKTTGKKIKRFVETNKEGA